ncbi:hypothetical protein M407DRAFT_216435 [Tulasnella calospora MUT 4182]|uniref:Uncharacterized protein n=1 Tax=Tulasnella calospora MUT 4182 TaxID=1051891 RepID=A0A0C3KM33_9AGAM|nr:hypothetical protein M407DRAFT_216435 [Tulasnella calospora MUT 4182]
MRRSLLALSIGGFLARAQHQTPLSTEPQVKVDLPKPLASDWNVSPNPDETGHLIFNSINGLLNHWQNAYYRNGHSIVPATIAPGTLLYHGRRQADAPPDTPEWVSFDPEHSYMFGWNVYTFVVGSEPLRVLYLDGSSAANMQSGTIDTQEILWYGELREGGWRDERHEIVELCSWGQQYDIHGFVRMEFDFEIMLCDFTKRVSLVSGLTLLPTNRGRRGPGGGPPPGRKPGEVPPGPPTDDDPLESLAAGHSRFETLPDDHLEPPQPPEMPPRVPWEDPVPPKGWKGSLLSGSAVTFGGIQAGNWHNAPSGLNGVILDHAGTISFFNPKYTSLVEARRGVDRMKWRAGNITKSDVELFRAELDAVLTRKEKGSDVRWDGLVRSVVERHADRLEFLSEWLGADHKNVTEGVVYARRTVLEMLAPYFVVDSIPSDYKTNVTWLNPTMHYCSTAYTSHLPVDDFTPQEHLLKEAVEVVTTEICRTLGVVWLDAFDAEAVQNETEQRERLVKWKGEIGRLMDWLGWAVWVKCKPICGPFELCSLPQWPFDMRWGDPDGGDDLTPRCMSRIELQGRRFRGDRVLGPAQ